MRNGTLFVGILLILVGIFGISYDEITYKKQESTYGVGPFQATVEKNVPVRTRMPLVLGLIVIGAGLYLVIAGRRNY